MTPTTPFTADGPEFSKLKLRPDLLQNVRESELIFRQAMTEMIDQLPTHVAERLQPVIIEMVARFILGLLPFFEGLSQMMDQAEMIQRQMRTRPGREVVN